MAKKTHNVKPVSVNKNNMVLELGTERLNRNLNDAQFALDSVIMTSMEPFMPKVDNSFIGRVRAKNAAIAGTGEVYAAVGPEGRFLYEGKTMVDEKTGSPWARKGARKVLVSQYTGKTKARENLQYSKGNNPLAQSHWFEAAKEKDGRKWKNVVDDKMSKP